MEEILWAVAVAATLAAFFWVAAGIPISERRMGVPDLRAKIMSGRPTTRELQTFQRLEKRAAALWGGWLGGLLLIAGGCAFLASERTFVAFVVFMTAPIAIVVISARWWSTYPVTNEEDPDLNIR